MVMLYVRNTCYCVGFIQKVRCFIMSRIWLIIKSFLAGWMATFRNYPRPDGICLSDCSCCDPMHHAFEIVYGCIVRECGYYPDSEEVALFFEEYCVGRVKESEVCHG